MQRRCCPTVRDPNLPRISWTKDDFELAGLPNDQRPTTNDGFLVRVPAMLMFRMNMVRFFFPNRNHAGMGCFANNVL